MTIIFKYNTKHSYKTLQVLKFRSIWNRRNDVARFTGILFY